MFKIIEFDELISTNKFALEKIANYPSGTVIRANKHIPFVQVLFTRASAECVLRASRGVRSNVIMCLQLERERWLQFDLGCRAYD